MTENIQGAMPNSSRNYISQRLRIHYLDWGNRGAPPVILVHGGQDHCRNWDWVAQAIRSDYHVITPDLRGHGDSDWSSDGQYPINGFVYDLAQLIDQLELAPVTLIGHSLGGSICLRYAGVYPEKVSRLVAIEGLGFSVGSAQAPVEVRIRAWVDGLRSLAARSPRRYDSLDDAVQRMRDANPHLNGDVARHLAVHGVRRNEDGTYSWKFDNYVRSVPPSDDVCDLPHLWARITCPVLLAWGVNSWASNPARDGRLSYFQRAEVAAFEGAGHWLHHDAPDAFIERLSQFLGQN